MLCQAVASRIIKNIVITAYVFISYLGDISQLFLPTKLGRHSMVAIEEGIAIIIGGTDGNQDQNAIHMLTCSNRTFVPSTLELTLSTPRSGFVAIPFRDDAECSSKYELFD